MSGWRPRSSRIAIDGAAFSLVFGLIWAFFRLAGLEAEEWLIHVVASTFALLAAFAVDQRRLVRMAVARAQNAERLVREGLNEVGLVQIYGSIDEALPDFNRELASAKLVRVYLQIGAFMLGSPHAPLFKALERRRADKNLRVELVVAAKASQFLSSARLQHRGHDVAVARTSLDNVHGQIGVLGEILGNRLDVRYHHEPFEWAVFFLDEFAYLAGYFSDRENRPPIYKFVRKDRSMYSLFEKHLTQLQAKYPPP